MNDDRTTVLFNALTTSICFDFVLKVAGKANCYKDTLTKLPLIDGEYSEALIARCLRLNCLSDAYRDLWVRVATGQICEDEWTSRDGRLCNDYELSWGELSDKEWNWRTPVRTGFARRQAMLEIDVLTALAIGMSIDELLLIYRVQFSVMQNYDSVDQYDGKGQHVPNTVRKNRGAREVRDSLEDWSGNDAVTVSWDLDNGRTTVTKTFYPPFTKVDREADYARAYEVLKQRHGV